MVVYGSLVGDDEFITHSRITHIQENPQIIFCSLQFNICQYQDGLYQKYGISLPSCVQKAVKKRKAEFLAGRVACKYALRKLGIESPVLISDPPNRFPIWPENVDGSISHSGNRAVVLVNASSISTGVDIESIREDSVSIIRCAINEIIPSESEKSILALNDCPLSLDCRLVLAFSAKESLFKALYKHVGHMFGFNSAALIEYSESAFKIQLSCDLTPSLTRGRIFQGIYSIEDDRIITYLLLTL